MICKICGCDKSQNDMVFHKTKSKYENICRRCRSKNTVINNARNQKRNNDYIRSQKTDQRCFFCNLPYHFSQLNFDHIDPSTKKFELWQCSSRSLESIKQEIYKCRLICANCHRERTQESFGGERINAATYLKEYSIFLKELKDNKQCADCGNHFPWYKLDFYHLHNKEFEISSAKIKRIDKGKVLNEIAKCELVCANCHRLRTYQRNLVSSVKIVTDSDWQNCKHGKLQLTKLVPYLKFSHKIVNWKCDCGRICKKKISYVTTGNTTSCGRCNELSREYLKSHKFGNLKMLNPEPMLSGSKKKADWICDCGKIQKIKFYDVTRGHTTSCGRCDEISAEEFRGKVFGSLKIKTPKAFLPGSQTKVSWICKCGKETKASIHSVTSDHTTSCGRCNELPPEHWEKTWYGYLKLANPTHLHPNSNKKLDWICKCGGVLKCNVCSVTSGKTVRCGKCNVKVHEWYKLNEQALRSLKTPFKKEDFPTGLLTPLENINRHCVPFRAFCGVCGNEYKPIWGNIVQGKSLTCGCYSGQVSLAQLEIADFIKSLGLDVKLEHNVGGLKYDVFVPSSNLLIEYQGLRWHSLEKSRGRDTSKYQNAISNKYDYLMIYEDEWAENRHKVQNLISNRILRSDSISLRPNQCWLENIKGKDTIDFYNRYHYIGACRAKVHIGVFYEFQLVGCVSFGHPTRQTIKHEWELLRMVAHPKFRVHGIWSKVIKHFAKEYNTTSIVSYSDNRLFQGGVYAKMGFRYDGNVAPDYYWVKNSKRFHKSGLRKTIEERETGLTEVQLREAQGYRKIYDLGKKRWVFIGQNTI